MVNKEYDSILRATPPNFINKTEYYKVGKDLPDHDIAMVERPYRAGKDDILMGCTLIIFAIISIVLYRNRDPFKFKLKDFFTSKRTYSNEKGTEGKNMAYSIFLLISIGVLSLSLMLFDHLAKTIGFSTVLGIPYWLFAGGYVIGMAFVYIKAWIYVIVNWTFFDSESGTKWMEGYLTLTALTSFLIFPISLLSILTNEYETFVTWTLIFTFILYELMLFFKLFVNFETKKYGYLLIILYFCSVELIPTIVMSRILVWGIDNYIDKILY